jgi:hypothetical protein
MTLPLPGFRAQGKLLNWDFQVEKTTSNPDPNLVLHLFKLASRIKQDTKVLFYGYHFQGVIRVACGCLSGPHALEAQT